MQRPVSSPSEDAEGEPDSESTDMLAVHTPDSRYITTCDNSASAQSLKAENGTSTPRKEKSRVRFNSNAGQCHPPQPTNSYAGRDAESDQVPVTSGHASNMPPRPRPSVLRTHSGGVMISTTGAGDLDSQDLRMDQEKTLSAVAAQERARHVADKVRRDKSMDVLQRTPSGASQDSKSSHRSLEKGGIQEDSDAELMPYPHHHTIQHGQDQDRLPHNVHSSRMPQEPDHEDFREEAYNLVRSHTRHLNSRARSAESRSSSSSNADGTTPPKDDHGEPSEVNDGSYDGVYSVPLPKKYRSSVLSQLLRLYKPATEVMTNHGRNWSTSTLNNSGSHQSDDVEKGFDVNINSESTSGTTTPTRRKWYEQNRSQETLGNLVEASTRLANPNLPPPDTRTPSPGRRRSRPVYHHRRRSSSTRVGSRLQKEQAQITVQIADILSRQEYIVKLCRALMLYGAPTHRLEEYLSMTARFLQIDGQFLYLPGSMVISFDDRETHTTEVRMVRSAQGIDLGKLKDVHRIYKEVIHDVMHVEEAMERLDALIQSPDKFNAWVRVIVFGLTSAMSAPFSFKARLIDLPLSFFFGCLVGFLQLIVSTRSSLYSNVFEVSAVVLVSFLARVFGSIGGGTLFCFSAMAQSGIVMLLPGYLVLCSALEIQSKAIVPGSIRIVYAVIYSLLLGFGITVGAALYGIIDKDATSATTCSNPMPSYVTFAFVPPFIICVSILYQAKWRQMPVMVVIAFAGYVVNFFSSRKFSASPQIANTLGALSVGLLANLYSRLRHGVAAATLIPAIFTQVPGGLASTGGLLSGLTTADMLNGDNSTQAVPGGVPTEAQLRQDQDRINAVVFNVAASMVQIAIGIAVGLFLSALIIYPLGKRRSGLFSF